MRSQQNPLLIHNLGYPRIGPRRELKTLTERFWAGKIDEDAFHSEARALRKARWLHQASLGVDLIPSNEWSLYDHVLDTICLVGALPTRFGWNGEPLDLAAYFRLARGSAGDSSPAGTPLEMTKWFDTNYHYLVPELEPGMPFTLSSSKPVDEFEEAAALGIHTKPVLLGPVTFLRLAKPAPGVPPFDRLALLDRLLPVYAQLLKRLAAVGATWVQLDEPIFALDLTFEEQAALHTAYAHLAAAEPGIKLLVATYFGELRDNLPTLLGLPVRAVHVDGVRGATELSAIAEQLPADMALSVGIVDGRNIWKTDLDRALALLSPVLDRLGSKRVLLAPSCSLLHVPISVGNEKRLDGELTAWLAFADEKLSELSTLARAATGNPNAALFEAQRSALAARAESASVRTPTVRARLAALREGDYCRAAPFPERRAQQQARLHLPLLPTTTIGSFPQTGPVRAFRSRWRRGEITDAEYEAFLEGEISQLIALQEELGLDVLVHGEYERGDMVEFFGELLDGFAHTEQGWVQSYGTRYVKPPIIYGDVLRSQPMTVRWLHYAQSQTSRPVKGMLTGPVTLAKWSFVRDDQPFRDTVLQLALAIRDEVAELEQAGIAVIQIDEPALREALPLRQRERREYLRWAVDAFRLAAAGAGPATQIHSHMCYAEFDDILDAIAELDVDVISIEATRSGMALLQALADFQYPNQIGPGIYDIHSPRVPEVEEMVGLLRQAAKVLPVTDLWVNPDCGLKTRQWSEVRPALLNLVAAARQVRAMREGR